MSTASGSASGPPWGLITAGGTIGKLAVERAELRDIGTELLRDIAMADAAARPFVETPDWRAVWNAGGAAEWATTASALESVYQQIHKLRDALVAFLGRDWAASQRTTAAYQWHSGDSGATPTGDDAVARECAWIDWLCRTRNRVVQHRLERGMTLVGFIAADAFFAAVHRPQGDVDLGTVAGLLREVQERYPVKPELKSGPADVAYAVAFSENLYELDRALSDALRRAAIASRVEVLLGSRYLIAHLDAALRVLVDARF